MDLVQERKLVWHMAELPTGVGAARQRNIRVNEVTGEALTVVEFATDWWRPVGFHHRDFEWFVIEGSLTIGEEVLGPLDYVFMPGGARIPKISATTATRVLLRRRSSWYFEEVDWHQPWAKGQMTIKRFKNAEWNSQGISLLRTNEQDETVLFDSSRKALNTLFDNEFQSIFLLEGNAQMEEEPIKAPIGLFPKTDGSAPLTGVQGIGLAIKTKK